MYTSALEMHIEVLQGVQKVAAYTDDMFSPEEIDLHLTKQQFRLVEDIINKKFEDSVLTLDYLKPLIEKNKKLQVYIPQPADSTYESDMVYGVLPSNYFHLVNNRSKIITSTDPTLCKDVSSFQTSATSTTSLSEYIAVIPMITSIATGAPYYCKFEVRLLIQGGLTVALATPSALWSIPSTKSGFYVSNYVLENFTYPGVQVYWETYRDTFAANSFIFVSTNAAITDVFLTSQVSVVNISSGGATNATFAPVAYTIPNYNFTTITGYTESNADNSLLEGEDLYVQNHNVFYRPVKTNPKSTANKQYLRAYKSKNFLISDLVIDYIRIPKQISLSLNQISELGGNAPSLVVNRTVEYLKMIIENPAYSAVLNDNKQRDPI